MVISVNVLGGHVYLKNGKKVDCNLFSRYKHIPPFAEFKVDDIVLSATVNFSGIIFDTENKVCAISWRLVLSWLKKLIGADSSVFLQLLTLSYPKKEFLVTRIQRGKDAPDFEMFLKTVNSIQCDYSRHTGLSGKPSTILLREVDMDYFKKYGKAVCRNCTLHMRESSLDGFLYKDHVLPLIQHMKDRIDEKYQQSILLLLDAFDTVHDQLLFYKHNEIWNSIETNPIYKLNDPKSLLEPGLNLTTILAKRTWTDFGIYHKKTKYIRELFQQLAIYRVWGISSFQHLNYAPISLKELKTIQPNFNLLLFGFVIVSVFEPELVKSIFSEVNSNATGYVHVFRDLSDKLIVPGVDSIHFSDLSSYREKNTTQTIVAWPAHFFTLPELKVLESFGSVSNPVILAGTPYVIGTHSTQIQGFTAMIEQGATFTFYGSNTLLSRQLEGTYPPNPIPINLLSKPRHTTLACPIYTKNNENFYHYTLLITLFSKLAYKPSFFSALTLVPGPLNISTEVEFALCG